MSYSGYDDPLIERVRDNGQSGDNFDVFSTVLSEPSAAEGAPCARPLIPWLAW